VLWGALALPLWHAMVYIDLNLINTRLAKDVMVREPQWTESIAVGSRAYVAAIGQTVRHRQRLNYSAVGESVWALAAGCG
jgi:hypothetical protein